MFISKTLAIGSATCRLSLLRNLTSVPIRTISAVGIFQASAISRQRIRFSSNVQQHDVEEEPEQRNTLDGQEDFENIKEEGEDVDDSVSSVPWYLQSETPQTVPHILSERQRIPDLPESPPPILEPMLQQISIDLGLDNLSLLDLRKLDPPPALGANLIMLIGTARSEKHLHVSADRLCRWLRSTYKLRPSADGLLGRNELKLKLRRKSRRAKLVGSAAEENVDDGIRTGWVCVDVGVVDSPEMNTEKDVPERTGFVGFGRRTDGVRTVVQMLTEEKREEIDLEHLWGGILRRASNPVAEDVEQDDSFDVTESAPTPMPLPLPPRQSHKTELDSQTRGFQVTQTRGFQITQSRGFHTSRHKRSQDFGSQPLMNEQEVEESQNPSLTEMQEQIQADCAAGDFREAFDRVFGFEGPAGRKKATERRRRALFLMEQYKIYLTNASAKQAISDLGVGYRNRSTPFLKNCYRTTKRISQGYKREFQAWLHCYARSLGHPGYGVGALTYVLDRCKRTGYILPSQVYFDLIYSIIRPAGLHQAASKNHHAPPRSNLGTAFDVIKEMHRKGLNVLDEPMFVTLLEATEPASELDIETVQPSTTVNDSFELPTKAQSPIQRRLHLLMINLDLPPFSDESRMRLMDMYAAHGHWIAFFDVWRMPFRQSIPQSPAMYAFMFQKVAESRHQKGCIKSLRTWMENLELEQPEVKIEGSVAEAIKACVLVAHPQVEHDARDPENNGEWVSLWRRCHEQDSS